MNPVIHLSNKYIKKKNELLSLKVVYFPVFFSSIGFAMLAYCHCLSWMTKLSLAKSRRIGWNMYPSWGAMHIWLPAWWNLTRESEIIWEWWHGLASRALLLLEAHNKNQSTISSQSRNILPSVIVYPTKLLSWYILGARISLYHSWGINIPHPRIW